MSLSQLEALPMPSRGIRRVSSISRLKANLWLNDKVA